MAIGNLHPNWKGDKACVGAKNKRARNWFKMKEQCDVCGEKAKDRHHIDGDPGNNIISNIMFLCRKCHMTIDERLNNIRVKRELKPPVECNNCGKLSKPLRKGLCHSCNEYFRRNGRHRPNFVEGSSVVTCGQLKLILELRKQGFSYRSIANVLNVGATAIRRLCILYDGKGCHRKEHE